MHIILFIFGAIIILYNLIVNVTNLTKIASYCIAENSIEEYWSTYYKVCVSGRAIYSTIISFFLAVLLFFILIPIILISSYANREKNQKAFEDGLVFKYQEIHQSEFKATQTYNNINLLGFEGEYTLTGKVDADFSRIVQLLKVKAEGQGKRFEYELLERITLDNRTAIIPVLLNIDTVDYPLYIVYNEEQKRQFLNVRRYFIKAGINDVIYFSALPL